jgi:glycosyl transferase, family 25
MKSFVITIEKNLLSNQAADRCIKSGLKHGITIEKFDAITPADDPIKLAEKFNIPTANFREKYSRFENCLAAFISHHGLWMKSIALNESILILEHDAVVIGDIPEIPYNSLVVNLGAPSYGKFKSPPILGLNMLSSKPYFGGAHGYIVTPKGAEKLIKEVPKSARPTDLYLNSNTFNWLQEYYPWPIEARDSFTTIQNENGCVAKHNYGETYEII